jgi:hypothetical protein
MMTSVKGLTMTQDEIIEMARQAGIWESYPDSWLLTKFAKLIAAKERADEREACAKIVEVSDDLQDWEIICGSEGRELLNEMAEAIRARGEPTSRGEA